FLLGVAPLVVATGAGAEMRQSLGTAVSGGMLGVTAFGLIFTPAFYTLVQRFGFASAGSKSAPQPRDAGYRPLSGQSDVAYARTPLNVAVSILNDRADDRFRRICVIRARISEWLKMPRHPTRRREMTDSGGGCVKTCAT